MIRDNKGRFVKGYHPRKISEETREKLRGRTPWNKGNKRYLFICNNCGSEVETSEKRRQYCSIKCSPRPMKTKRIIKKCMQCKKKIEVPKWLIDRKKFCSTKCRADYWSTIPSHKHYNWKGGRVIQAGYAYILCEKKYVLESRLIMEKFIKRKLKKSEIVHHINENRLDNRIENLKIMTRKEHINHHKPHVKL